MTLTDRLAQAAPAGVTLRVETDQDRPFVERLYASTREQELASVQWPADVQQAFLHSQCALQRAHYQAHYGGARLLLIEHDRTPVGRIYLHESDSEIRLMDIALLPAARAQGTGTALLRAVLDHAGDAALRVTLHVEPGNPAQRLYSRLGFRLVEQRGVYDFLEWKPPPPLETLTAGHFDEVLRQAFTLRRESGDTVPLVLTSVTHRAPTVTGGRAGFSLIFESNSGIALPQRIYRLEQTALGVMDLFLVPLGPGDTGIRYEAVFG